MQAKVPQNEMEMAKQLELDIRQLRNNWVAEVKRCDSGINRIHSHVLGYHIEGRDEECPVCLNS